MTILENVTGAQIGDNINVQVDPITAYRGHVQALAFARKGGHDLSLLLTSIANQKAAERQGSLATFLFLDEHFTDEEQSAIPVPGSKKEDSGNQPYDKYTTEVTTENGKRKVPGSWFTDVVKNTEEAEHTHWLIDCCKDITTENCPDDIKNMSDGERRKYVKELRQRLTDARTGLVKGAQLWHHVKDIEKLNPERIEVKLPFKVFKVTNPDGSQKMNEDGAVTETRIIGSSILLLDPAKEIGDKVFSVSEFLSLKPAVLENMPKDQRTTTALEETKAKKPGGKADGKGGGKAGGVNQALPPTTVEGFLHLCNAGTTAIDTEDEKGTKLNSQLIAAFAGTSPDVEDKIETFGDFALAIDGIWTMIAARYNAIKARKAAAINAKAQAERTAKKTGT